MIQAWFYTELFGFVVTFANAIDIRGVSYLLSPGGTA